MGALRRTKAARVAVGYGRRTAGSRVRELRGERLACGVSRARASTVRRGWGNVRSVFVAVPEGRAFPGTDAHKTNKCHEYLD